MPGTNWSVGDPLFPNGITFINETLEDEDDVDDIIFNESQVQNCEVSSTKSSNSLQENIVISDYEEDDKTSDKDEKIDLKASEDELLLADWHINSEGVKFKTLPYTLVCIHIETISISNDPYISLTQVGCVTALSSSDRKSFFQPIKPSKLEYYLQNYKMEGDLLKALHMTDENGRFEFRGQFEIKRKEKNKVYADTEENVLKNLCNFLKPMSNIVLCTVDEDSLKIILRKVSNLKDFEDVPVIGYTTWPKVLEFGATFDESFNGESDLEDFYTNYCGDGIKGYISALDVSNILGKSVKKLFDCYAVKVKLHKQQKFIEANIEDIKDLELMKLGTDDANQDTPVTIEVYSSFRPEVSSRIGIMKMETIELSSGEESEDSDVEIMHENVSQIMKKRNMDMLSFKRKKPLSFPERSIRRRHESTIIHETVVISSDEEEDVTLDDSSSSDSSNDLPGDRDIGLD